MGATDLLPEPTIVTKDFRGRHQEGAVVERMTLAPEIRRQDRFPQGAAVDRAVEDSGSHPNFAAWVRAGSVVDENEVHAIVDRSGSRAVRQRPGEAAVLRLVDVAVGARKETPR